MKTTLFSLLLTFLVMPLAAQYDYEVGGLFYKRIADGQVEVTFHDSASCVYYYRSETDYNSPETKHNYYSGDITIPTSVTTSDGTYAVTRIGDWAFAYAEGITSITLPESVISIGRGAFYRTDFALLNLNASLTTIGPRAFTGGVIETVDVPSIAAWLAIKFEDSNANPIWAGGGDLRVAGEPIVELEIPEGTTEVHDFAFGIVRGIQDVTFPSSLRRIGQMAFYYNTELLTLNLPEGLEKIDYGAFNLCSSVTDISLPSSLRLLAPYAFAGCHASSITIPAGVDSIGIYALYMQDDALQEIHVDRNNLAFSEQNGILYDKNLTRLICYPSGKNDLEYTMPATLREVYPSALCNNQYLTHIDLSPALQKIGANGLATTQDIDINVTDLAAFCRLSLMDDGDADFYPPWNNFRLFLNGEECADLVIPGGVTSLGRMQFVNCQNIESVTLPEGLTTVRQFALGLCPNLRRLYLPATTSALEFYAFAYSPFKEIHAAMTNPVPFETAAGDGSVASLYNINPFYSYVATLYVPVGCVETYQQTSGWNAFPVILEDTEENQPREDVFKEIGRGTYTSSFLGRSYIATLSRSLTNPTHYHIAPFIYNEDGADFTVTADGRIYMDEQSTGWDYSGYGLIYASDPLTYGFTDVDLGTASLFEDRDFYGTFNFHLTYYVSAGYFNPYYTDTFQLEELTGITAPSRDATPAADLPTYDLQGRPVVTSALKKGIYIRQNQKLLHK